MKLILLRHGEASFDAASDFERTLTVDGCAMITERAIQLRNQSFLVEQMISSPFVRTVQTADLIAATLNADVSLSATPILRSNSEAFVPDAGVETAMSALSLIDPELSGALLVVTHQPMISELIFFLTEVQQPMAPGGMVLIDLPVIAAGFGEIECVF